MRYACDESEDYDCGTSQACQNPGDEPRAAEARFHSVGPGTARRLRMVRLCSSLKFKAAWLALTRSSWFQWGRIIPTRECELVPSRGCPISCAMTWPNTAAKACRADMKAGKES